MTRLLHPLLAVALLSTLPACGSSTTVLEEGSGGSGGDDGPPPVPVGPGSSGGTGQGGGQTGGCLSNAQCIDENGQLPYVCPAPDTGAECAAVLSPDCTVLDGGGDPLAALRDDRAVVLGALVPLSGANAALGQAQANAMSLALDELHEAAGGLPGAEGARVPVVIVVCDEAAGTDAAARHLIDDLGVPLFLGPSDGDRLVAWATGIAIPAGAMVLSPSAEHPALGTLADGGLLWQARSVAAHGGALAGVAARLEPQLGGGGLRVALVAGDDASSQAVAAAFLEVLVLNDQSAADNVAAGELVVIAMAPESVAETTVVIADMLPDLVVVVLPEPDDLVAAVEASVTPPPAWLAALPSQGGEALAAGLEERFFGVRTGAPLDGALLDQMEVRYASRFGEGPPFAAAEAYDAAYAAFYALAAAVPEGASGASIAAAMSRVAAGGIDVAVGPGDLNAGLAALTSGASINLQGATGSLDADLETGSFPRSIEVLCSGGAGLAPSGLVVDEAGALVGSSTCL